MRQRDGHWHYRFEIDGHPYSGNTRVPALGAAGRRPTAEWSKAQIKNFEKAQAIEVKARDLVVEGRGAELRVQAIPFSEAAGQFLAWCDGEYTEHPATVDRIRTSFVSIQRFFGKRSVVSITPGDVEDYKAWRRKCPVCLGQDPAVGECDYCEGDGLGVRNITIRHDLHALGPFFRYAIKHHWVRRNPCDEVEIPSAKDSYRCHVLTAAEEQAYFAACLKLGYQDLHDLARLMLWQGTRPSEVRMCRKSDIDLITGTWRIPQSKTAAGVRALKLQAASLSIMARRMSSAGPLMFPSRAAVDTPVGELRHQHAEVLQKCGLYFCPYDLRHTFATRAAEAGVDVATLAKILGHTNARITLRYYVHITDEHTRRAMDKIEASAIERTARQSEPEEKEQEQEHGPIN